MSTKRYLTLEAAAAQLGIKPDELIRLREKGDVRGFADRGTWKFKSEDIDELGRRLRPDSAPEVSIIDDDDAGTLIGSGASDGSDSDVQLVSDDRNRSKLSGSSAELLVMGAQSDSDVRLSDEPGDLLASDSDVRLVAPGQGDSDSDVQLSDSDSDVKLAAAKPSDSDVQLMKKGKKKPSDSDVSLLSKSSAKGAAKDANAATDVDFRLAGEGADSDMVLEGDSGISLVGDSGISLAGGDSGIRLQDSPVARAPLSGDDDIALQDDSGIQLSGGDSGISLDVESGIRLAGQPPSGVKRKPPAPKDELASSIPLLLSDDAARTDAEVPMIPDDDFETAAIPVARGKKKGDTSEISVEDFDAIDEETFGGESDVEEDELEVADDILGEDDELEQLEVFDSDDADFGESFVEGGSAVDIAVMSSRMAVPEDHDWSTATLVMLSLSTVALFAGAIVAADLMQNAWAGATPSSSPLLGFLSSVFK